jgi:methyl-accepting chemotaxis protein
VSGSDIAGLIAAGVFAVLVALLAVPIVKLGRVFDELRQSIRSLADGATPLMDEVTSTVSTTHEQLKKVDGIAANVSDATANVSALSSLIAATVGSPLVKVASFSYGLRTARAQRSDRSKPTGRRSR